MRLGDGQHDVGAVRRQPPTDVTAYSGSCRSFIWDAASLATTSAAKATAAKSSTTKAITAAALEVLEALALFSAAEPVLGLAVQITKAASGSIEAPFTRTVLAACARAIVIARCRRSLLIAFGSRPLLTAFRPLPVRLGLIYGIPASVVVLLPTVTGVLVNVAIVPGIHVAAGSFGGCSASPGCARADGFTALRT